MLVLVSNGRVTTPPYGLSQKRTRKSFRLLLVFREAQPQKWYFQKKHRRFIRSIHRAPSIPTGVWHWMYIHRVESYGVSAQTGSGWWSFEGELEMRFQGIQGLGIALALISIFLGGAQFVPADFSR